MEHPFLALGRGQRVHIEQHVPLGGSAPVTVPGRPPPQALRVLPVPPEVVIPVPVLTNHGDLVGGVQHLEDLSLQPGIVGVFEQVLGAGVLFADPGQLLLAVNFLKPDVFVGRFGRGPVPGFVAGRGGVVISCCGGHDSSKQHLRAASKSHADTLEDVGTTQSIRTALIGAGPRGTSVLERLLAHWSRLKTQGGSASGFHPSATLHIHVIDPYPPGPGHVWQPGQSRLYLMNTQSFYPTVIPEDPELVPPVAGRTFDHWRTRQQEQPLAGLTADERAELAALGSRDFPSRALYGRYLSSTLQDLLAASPDGVTVDFHRTTATAARRAGKGAAGEGTF
ncbi:conserved hypothetical protein, partial [Arthrobacter sp. Hiyo6]